MAEEIKTEETTELAVQDQETELQVNKPEKGISYLDGKELNRIYKNAVILAKSSLLPERYRSKAEDVMILMDLCSRMGVSLFALANGTYPVHGQIGLNGQFCIALINGSGKFTPLDFVFVNQMGDKNWGCYAIATRRGSGIVCKSATITMQMATDEGWLRNPKWKTMPEQMLKYRAASFFMRTYCPELTLGMYTTEELEDVYGTQQPQKQKTKITLNGVEPEVYIESEADEVVE